MNEIETIQTRYREWFEKTSKNLLCTKGNASKVLLSRIQCLMLHEDLLGYKKHIAVLNRVVSQYAVEEDTLRWVSKLADDCRRWQTVFESLLQCEGVSVDSAIRVLLDEDMDIELAIGLVQCRHQR